MSDTPTARSRLMDGRRRGRCFVWRRAKLSPTECDGSRAASTTLRLARAELGDDVYRRENLGFRDAGRRLSGARDSRVLVETLAALCERYRDKLPPGGFGALQDVLRNEHEAAQERERADAGGVGDVVRELRAARARVASWTIGCEDLDALAPGLRRIYRRGGPAPAAAPQGPGDQAPP